MTCVARPLDGDGSRARLLGIEPGRLARGDRRVLGADAHGAVDDVDGDGVVAGDFVGDGRRRLELGVEQRDRNLELLDVGAGMSGDGADMETGGDAGLLDAGRGGAW